MQVLKDEIREKIMEVATQEFMDKGFQASSTRDIVKKVSISKGNLYNYFPSKEELFYAITTPFHHQFNHFLQQLCSHSGNENFNLDNVELMAKNTARFVTDYRKQLVIIMNKSEGTKYAGYKEETITVLQKHFAANLKPEFHQKSGWRTSLMHIIARNFLEALINIAKECKNDEEAVFLISLFLKYHIKGVAQFY